MPEPTHSPEVWGLWHVQAPPFPSQNSQGTNCPTASFRLEINPPILTHHTARTSLLHEHSYFLGQFKIQARPGTVLRVFLTLKSADCFKSKELLLRLETYLFPNYILGAFSRVTVCHYLPFLCGPTLPHPSLIQIAQEHNLC